MQLNRRGFIASAAAGLSAAMMTRASAQVLADTLGGTRSSWEELRQAVGGNLYMPADRNFALRAAVNNLRYMALLPEAVAVVSSVSQVQATLQWCKANRFEFRIKGGGHSYAGFSTCPKLVISTEGLGGVSLGPGADPRVEVGGGIINYDLYDALARARRTITHGRCSTVGISGFVLGGGIGFDMRRLGMACDLLESASIVLADGRFVTASERAYTDLFWALRGGAGGNFGICTGYSFRTVDVAAEELIVFQRQYATGSITTMRSFLSRLLAGCEAMPNGFGSRISVRYVKPAPGIGGEPQFLVDFLGQSAGGRARLAQLFSAVDEILRPNVLIDFRGEYWQGQHLLAEEDAPAFYQERSTFLKTTPADEAIIEALRMLTQRPDVHGTCDLRFFQTGGEIDVKRPDATAYVHRGNHWLALVGYYWQARDLRDPGLIASGHDWQNRFYRQIVEQFDGAGAFQNFPDISLQNWAEAYYGGNLKRLREVKQAYDPDGLFDFPQALQNA
ncbi:FAD-binding oxidoreductase [Rhizobium halophytocola]|uniref:FAD/FMN-containing dehydrogenase n=1 Tax=Rhizobium halophytocola TaxID=735519 RepID=A0ABS4DY57_9HYPH|nr:FAD-binding oxidoreductase [Rhizobium halophytocola]MBP1850626.1 FAD/FMN-containing dehydrogenase [Rhizobium halophytocola]